MSKIRTRFAPSPTGFLHIGGLRTALYAYALAKNQGGDFILRIEDTDQKREVEGATLALQSTLQKFGLNWDEFYKQSDRLDKYKKAAEELVTKGQAFYCDCKPKNAKEQGFSVELRDPCRDQNKTSGAIKLKVPKNKTLTYKDFVHKKEISWNSDSVYDATLLKSDGFPTYHLAVAVDDLDMQITHILRGHDWLPSTPIHLLVFQYLGGTMPQIGHLTDILSGETGKKLSKRRDSVFAEQFLDQGYVSEALLNFVMLLGWAPKDNRELYTLKEFVENFDIKGFQESNPRFFYNKLDWFNGHYIRLKEDDFLQKEFERLSTSFAGLPNDQKKSLTVLLKDRIKKLTDINDLAGYIFKKSQEIEPLKITENYKNHISQALEAVKNIKDWDLENINSAFTQAITKNTFKVGDFYMDLRGTISGNKFTPPLNETLVFIGKDEVQKRLEKGLK